MNEDRDKQLTHFKFNKGAGSNIFMKLQKSYRISNRFYLQEQKEIMNEQITKQSEQTLYSKIG